MRCKPAAATLILALFGISVCYAEEATEKTGEIDIPVAIGQTVKGIRLPHYDKDKGGKLSLRLHADSAERASETQFNFKNMRVEIFDQSADKPAMEVLLDTAVFDRATSLLTSNDRAVIKGEQFEITGSRLEFETRTRASRLAGPVLMTITDLAEEQAR